MHKILFDIITDDKIRYLPKVIHYNRMSNFPSFLKRHYIETSLKKG